MQVPQLTALRQHPPFFPSLLFLRCIFQAARGLAQAYLAAKKKSRDDLRRAPAWLGELAEDIEVMTADPVSLVGPIGAPLLAPMTLRDVALPLSLSRSPPR